MNKTIAINWQVNTIQQVRLIHALAESDFPVYLPSLEAEKFILLKEKFALELARDSGGEDFTPYLVILHPQPTTNVGDLSRPLIFPHVITDYCLTLWPERREFRYSFQGLMIPPRRILIQDWIDRNLRGKIQLRNPATLISRIRKKLRKKLGCDNTEKFRAGDLFVYSSDRGRIFPIKAWDEEYFRILASSQFVLCPGGDYPWSYRFFESILCGAIPIIEKYCESYDGFRFHSFTDDITKIKWSLEDAEHNYRLCVEKLTIPKSILNAELSRLIAIKTTAVSA
ncbi:MAG TPA: exostosin family protein [Lacunisphaera sp.]|jgi:hypothetical protein